MSKKISVLPEYSGVLPDASFVPIVADGSTYKYKLPDITDGVALDISTINSTLNNKQDDISQLGYIKFSEGVPDFPSSDPFIWVNAGVLYFRNSSGNIYTVDLTLVV